MKIAVVNMGPGSATLRLVDPKNGHTVLQQVLAHGTAYLLSGNAVTLYKHVVSAPTGGGRYVLVGRYMSQERFEELQERVV